MLRAGSDVESAPFEFYTSPGHMDGFEIELITAVSAKLGQPIVVQNQSFDSLIGSVHHGWIDLAVSTISDTRQREEAVDFIDYFVDGGGIMVAAGNPHRIFSISALCGYSVAVETGTSYETALRRQAAACEAIGLAPLAVTAFPSDGEAFVSFEHGYMSAYVTDYPIAAYLARTAGGGKLFEMAGGQFDIVPYGIAIAKNNRALLAAISRALAGVIADGTYDALLRKWHLSSGALRSVPINAGTLFEQ